MGWFWGEIDGWDLCVSNIPGALVLQDSWGLVWFVQQGGLRATSKSRIGDTGEGTALSALTGGGMKLRDHHFRLSLVPCVLSQGQSSARCGCPWLSLCPQLWFLVLLAWVTSPNQLTRCLDRL